jgi:hypothetical protein
LYSDSLQEKYNKNHIKSQQMNELLKKVKDIQQKGCVTIILNTHRTRPDNEKDPIALKNLVKDAEQRLQELFDKKFATVIMQNLQEVVEKIDHQHNQECLIIFANTEFADYTRLPVEADNRVVVDNTFATRDLVRAMHQQSAYYILVLSRKQARMIEAFSDRVVQEITGDFPLENTLFTNDKAKLSTNKGTDNLIEEFFNKVDKLVLETTRKHPLPLLLATETRNFDHYVKIADKKENIIGHINRNRDDEKAHHILPDAWKVVQEINEKNNRERIQELHKAVSENKFLSDLNDIYLAIGQGRGRTLFVKKDYYHPAIIEDGKILLSENLDINRSNVIDDVIDEMIELNISFGGDTVFMDGQELDKFGNIALITRY